VGLKQLSCRSTLSDANRNRDSQFFASLYFSLYLHYSSYPESTQILDWFHCTEKLHVFARECFKDKPQREEWISQQEELLLDGGASLVIAAISLIPCKGKAKQMQRSLLTYYKNNQKRMDYKRYKEEGY
jgi:hypothetical protein